MSYERWAKRMDDAVESTWLRGLRSQTQVARTSRHVFVPNLAAGKSKAPRLSDRSMVAGAER